MHINDILTELHMNEWSKLKLKNNLYIVFFIQI